jgi:hypothetical protein
MASPIAARFSVDARVSRIPRPARPAKKTTTPEHRGDDQDLDDQCHKPPIERRFAFRSRATQSTTTLGLGECRVGRFGGRIPLLDGRIPRRRRALRRRVGPFNGENDIARRAFRRLPEAVGRDIQHVPARTFNFRHSANPLSCCSRNCLSVERILADALLDLQQDLRGNHDPAGETKEQVL